MYPSWIEIPVVDLERALAFYRAVFRLDETPRYQDGMTQIVVLLPSDKSVRSPGVSLVQSPAHTPGPHGFVVNFHVGDHAALTTAVQAVERHGGTVNAPPVDDGDGQRSLTVRDSEGNTLALSSYDPPTGV